MSSVASHVRLDGRRDPQLSRWLWLVKWILVLPHALVLAVLWPVFVVLTLVAGIAVLLTGRYPHGIFAVNLGILRWTWRVAFYAYSALGTDRYPPFTCGEAPEYPARLDVAYPAGGLARRLVLVKWLLAIPHLIVVAVLVGSGGWVLSQGVDGAWDIGVVPLLSLGAGLTLAFTGRYPAGLFDLLLGLDRWVVRVGAYVGLMTDEYPPFRLDQGGTDPATIALGASPAAAAPIAPTHGPTAAPSGDGPRTALVILGGLAGLATLAFGAAGALALWADRTQREDGFVMTDSTRQATATFALESGRVELDARAPGVLDAADLLGTIRVRAASERPLFVGIATTADADRYLADVARAVVTDVGDGGGRRRTLVGGPPPTPPQDAGIWVASSRGAGTRTVDWTPAGGTWTLVVMDAAGRAGVTADVAIGAELDDLGAVAASLLGAALLAGGAAVLLLVLGLRRRAP